MTARRWTILAVGTFAQAATCCFLYGIPMLVPALRVEGSSLFAASIVVSPVSTVVPLARPAVPSPTARRSSMTGFRV